MNAPAFALALSGAVYRGTMAGVIPDDQKVVIRDIGCATPQDRTVVGVHYDGRGNVIIDVE